MALLALEQWNWRWEGDVKVLKRLAIAVGSLFALVLAGGAHMRF
jgi:hypothetical protein